MYRKINLRTCFGIKREETRDLVFVAIASTENEPVTMDLGKTLYLRAWFLPS